MSDKVELVASAQVAVVDGVISFTANYKFKTATRSSAGSYDLEMDDKHDGRKLVIAINAKSNDINSIQADPASQGDTKHILITNFDASDNAADTSFFITVSRIGHVHGC